MAEKQNRDVPAMPKHQKSFDTKEAALYSGYSVRNILTLAKQGRYGHRKINPLTGEQMTKWEFDREDIRRLKNDERKKGMNVVANNLDKLLAKNKGRVKQDEEISSGR